MDAARVVSGMYERSVFSRLGTSFRTLLNQECDSSTTHLPALNFGSLARAFFSSPLGRTCGMNPFSSAVASLPTYAASRQRFCFLFLVGETTRPFNKGSSETLPCRLAPVTTSDKGTPFASTRMFRLVPFFPPVRGVGSDRLLCQRRLEVAPIRRLPEPGDSLHFIVLGQTPLPKFREKSGIRPLLKLSMNHCRPNPLELLPGQCVPDDPCPKHVYDRREKQPMRVLGLATPARLAFVNHVRVARRPRNQRLHQIPKLVGYFPRFDARQGRPPSVGIATRTDYGNRTGSRVNILLVDNHLIPPRAGGLRG